MATNERFLDRVPTKRDWILPLVMAGLSFAMSAYAAYSNNDKAITGRVIKLETQREGDVKVLDRIETKVDKLDEKVDRLLERKK